MKLLSKPALFDQLADAVLSLFAGAVLVVVLFWAYYMAGLGAVSAVFFQPDGLTLVVGQGGRTGDGLEIRQTGEEGIAFASSSAVDVPAELYSRLIWTIEGLREQTDIHFVWATRRAPSTMREVPMQYTGEGLGQLDLALQRDWRESIVGIGLMIYGELPEPLIVRRLELRQATPDFASLVARLRAEWSVFEGWSQRSINFVMGGIPDGLFPPVLAAAAWCGLSSLFYLGLTLARRRSWRLQSFAVFFLVAWLALDARWQWDLWRQLELTYDQFAGKTWQEKRLAEEDGVLFQWVQKMKQHLPQSPVRLFVITADPAGATNYVQNRAHYHLLPHNVHSFLSRPPHEARPGDYVLVINPVQNIRYRSEDALLVWDEHDSLPADLIHSTAMGALFRVRQGS